MSPRDAGDRVLAFAHIGDLHVTDANQPNFIDFMSILVQLETQAKNQLDFVVLPGDCADHGLPEQYALIKTALRMLSIPVHIIPGDHDMEPGSLDNFHRGLAAKSLPRSEIVSGHRCLFLDFCSAGAGGPDFRLGEDQLSWIAEQLMDAKAAAEECAVFMHGYPADLRGKDRADKGGHGEADRLTQLLSHRKVALVDMGHTHYNELVNDGATIFAATRSTGQIDEGPVGYSITTIDEGVVSWRFKPLDDPFPFVMITSPADHRLLRGKAQRVIDGAEVRARIFGDGLIARAECQVNEEPWRPMRQLGKTSDWAAFLPALDGKLIDITVRVFSESGRPGLHAIRAAGPAYEIPAREPTGDDAHAIGAWPENGVFGTQLGPNRNGRKW